MDGHKGDFGRAIILFIGISLEGRLLQIVGDRDTSLGVFAQDLMLKGADGAQQLLDILAAAVALGTIFAVEIRLDARLADDLQHEVKRTETGGLCLKVAQQGAEGCELAKGTAIERHTIGIRMLGHAPEAHAVLA